MYINNGESQGSGEGTRNEKKKGVELDKEEFVCNKISSEKFFEKLKWITTKEVAIYLSVSVGQVRNMVWRGQLVSYKLNNRLRFLKSDVDKIVKTPNDWRIHD